MALSKEDLRNKYKILQAIFDSLPDGVVAADENGVVKGGVVVFRETTEITKRKRTK